MASIAHTESGGNYNARSPHGAYGKFQIMPANWPSWSREAGLGGQPQSAANQERVARYKMTQYYRQFGSWDLVAAAWFSGPGTAAALKRGDMSVLKRSDGNINVAEYIRRITARMGSSGGMGIPNIGDLTFQGPTPQAMQLTPRRTGAAQNQELLTALFQGMSDVIAGRAPKQFQVQGEYDQEMVDADKVTVPEELTPSSASNTQSIGKNTSGI